MDPHVSTALPRIDVTQAQIRLVADRFYARVRKDPVLAPIFHTTIGQDATIWEAHIDKITHFWRNALLREPVYSGNPMLVHSGISAIRPEHFALWLGLFDAVLTETLPPDTTALWSRTAHRIGRGLSLGLASARARQDGVPDLRL
jgi:hemoglobin